MLSSGPLEDVRQLCVGLLSLFISDTLGSFFLLGTSALAYLLSLEIPDSEVGQSVLFIYALKYIMLSQVLLQW